MFPLSMMQRQRLILTRQTKALHSFGSFARRGSYPLLRSSRTVVPRTLSTDLRFVNTFARATQTIQIGRSALLRSVGKKPLRKILPAWIAFTVLVSSVYEPLRDRGFLGGLADFTIFRIIPPKLVEVPDGIDETKYRPLTREKEIRLLILEPGAPGDELKCRIVHAERSWRTRYEALSYFWGDGKVKRHISCSGRDELVYDTLHDALSDLRFPDRERVLWTDRLCINQSDNAEFSAQMKLMGDIYSQASRVLIYLGKADDSVKGTIEGIRQGDSAWRAFSASNPLRILYALWCMGFGNAMNWDPTINLLLCPWFQRTWTFQEAVLAKRAQVICGAQSIPWKP